LEAENFERSGQPSLSVTSARWRKGGAGIGRVFQLGFAVQGNLMDRKIYSPVLKTGSAELALGPTRTGQNCTKITEPNQPWQTGVAHWLRRLNGGRAQDQRA
jgi:hypothetical protein